MAPAKHHAAPAVVKEQEKEAAPSVVRVDQGESLPLARIPTATDKE